MKQDYMTYVYIHGNIKKDCLRRLRNLISKEAAKISLVNIHCTWRWWWYERSIGHVILSVHPVIKLTKEFLMDVRQHLLHNWKQRDVPG